jgi:4-amino-4-deoxy-L-arabinose transferase-like glycosyltransferase
LLAVLSAQAGLSLRLIWKNTAFLDEGTYIWAGRIELWHLTSGTPVPDYASYFSGAPVIYPPLAGLADIMGGLAAVRLLSLAFMLGVSVMLWGTARSLFGQRAALCAVSLFCVVGSTQFLGALATYDAMGLFLLTLSVRLVVAARYRDDSALLILGAVAALAAANATKYATGIFDPVVIAIAVLTRQGPASDWGAPSSPRGLKAGLGRGGMITTITVGLLAALLAAGGPYYIAGLEFTTIARSDGGMPALLVLANSARWIGAIVAAAAIAIAIAWWRRRADVPIMILLALAGILVPVNQARIHTTVSLVKHVDFGAWFACAAAGYAIAMACGISKRAWVRGAVSAAVAVVILAGAGAPGRAQAADFVNGWPDTAQLVVRLRDLIGEYPGVYLAEDPEVFGYYFEDAVPWQDWRDTWYVSYRPPGTVTCLRGSTSGLSLATASSLPSGRALTQAIAHKYFGLVMLNFGDTPKADHVIAEAIRRYATYHVVAQLEYGDRFGRNKFVVWAPDPGRQAANGSGC